MNVNRFPVIVPLLMGACLCAGSLNGKRPARADIAQTSFAQEMQESMAAMDQQMMSARMTGNPDHDFASMMIPHHRGAVAMAEAELKSGKDPVLRRLAQEIIVTQRQEIQVMALRLSLLEAPHQRKKGPTPKIAPGKVELPPQPTPVSSLDRVYTADQTSNTVSVINPATNRLLGIIRLGDPAPGSLSPLYRGQSLVHGMGFSPDHKTLAVVSIGSNSVTFIDTASNRIRGVVYVGRSPHEAFFSPNGKEVWVAVRGENYVSIIDAKKMSEVRRVLTANGPAMILFHPDGRYAYIPSSFTPEVDVVDAKSYKVIARVPQASPFSPNLAVSQDGTEVWFTLKDSGKTQVMSGNPPFRILTTLNTGPISNHVALIDVSSGKYAYVTVGGLNLVKVFRRGPNPKLIATIPIGDLPHGIWQSGDGSRVYIGLENQDAVAAIDTRTNKIIATIPIGQQPQALVYVPRAVPTGNGRENLMPLGSAGEASHISMIPAGSGSGSATVSVNSLGAVDLLQIAVSGLLPKHDYQVWLVDSRLTPYGPKQLLINLKTNAAGAQIGQTIGPLKQILSSSPGAGSNLDQRRFLLVTDAMAAEPVLIQNTDN
jgi:YVTN family beta-propeller protein